MVRKLYTKDDYFRMANQANEENKKLIKVQEERQVSYEVYEYEKKTIQVPIYNDDGEIIDYQTIEVDDLDKPIMVDEIDPKTGETIKVHKHHTEYRTEIVEYLEIVDYSEEEKRQQLDSLYLTKRDVLSELYKDKGITPESIKNLIGGNELGLIEFEYANNYYRGNPLINQLGEALGYTTEELDTLFKTKKLEE